MEVSGKRKEKRYDQYQPSYIHLIRPSLSPPDSRKNKTEGGGPKENLRLPPFHPPLNPLSTILLTPSLSEKENIPLLNFMESLNLGNRDKDNNRLLSTFNIYFLSS